MNPLKFGTEWNIVKYINVQRKGLQQRFIKGIHDVVITLCINKHTIKTSFHNAVVSIYTPNNITYVLLSGVGFLYTINGVHDKSM